MNISKRHLKHFVPLWIFPVVFFLLGRFDFLSSRLVEIPVMILFLGVSFWAGIPYLKKEMSWADSFSLMMIMVGVWGCLVVGNAMIFGLPADAQFK